VITQKIPSFLLIEGAKSVIYSNFSNL